MQQHQPYSIPLRRELLDAEKALLLRILEREAPHRIPEVAMLKVVARCGCGKCPTVIFGAALDAEPRPARPFTEVANYMGINAEGLLVGVVLLEREGCLSELEAWSPKGGEVMSWPEPANLERVGEGGA